MDLNLKKENLHYYELHTDFSQMHEDTLETIVPDYCPDIAHILNVDGNVADERCDVSGAKVTVNGTAEIAVMYTTDGENSLHCLKFSMPFSITEDMPDISGCERISSVTEICSVESRCLNPRKVFSRAVFCAKICGVSNSETGVSTDVDNTEGISLEKRICSGMISGITDIEEKEFNFVDELSISPGKEAIAEILHCDCCIGVDEIKHIGRKLVVRSLLHLNVLYRAEDGSCGSAAKEMQVSQIMEIGEAADNTVCSADIAICGTEVHVGSEEEPSNRRIITANFRLKISAVLKERREITYLNDAYSTSHHLLSETVPLQLSDMEETTMRRIIVRETIETGTAAKSVLLCTARSQNASVDQTGGTASIKCVVRVHLVYSDENGTPAYIDRNLDTAYTMDIPAGCEIAAKTDCSCDINAVAAGGGIELAIPVDFTIHSKRAGVDLCISKLTVDMDNPKNISELPSIIIRRIETGETLWDIAKHSSSSVSDIRMANSLADNSEAAAGSLLLIPKKR